MNNFDENDDDSFGFKASWNMVKRLADQISHPSIAVAELIKNSYDADATEVLINMKQAMGKREEDCKFILMDNGHGMTKKDIQTKWANIGISHNTSHPFSVKGRARQGGKGLGRFGAWKLGQKVTLATRAKNNPTFVLTIDFSEYPPDTPLEDVRMDILVDPPAFKGIFPENSTGTYLLVEKFNATMTTTSDIQKIQRNTQTLLNPFEENSDFDIILQLPQKFEKWEQYDFTQITNQALYKFEVSIDSRGQNIEGTFTNNNKYSNEYELETPINIPTTDLLEGKRCQVSAVKVWIYHFRKAVGYKKLWPTTRLGLLKKDDYNDNLAGFRLYKDNVRVFPYGEPGNDWLQLDYMQNKERSADWFSNTQIVAAARFSLHSNIEELRDKSNREGLEETVGKRQLFQILKKLVKIMRSHVNKGHYPIEQPTHLKEPDFEYGSFTLTTGEKHNLVVRNIGGDITKNYTVTKGTLPKGMRLDSKTGTVSGIPTEESDYENSIEITSGNKQGNHATTLTISEIKKPEPIQTQIVSGSENLPNGNGVIGTNNGQSTHNVPKTPKLDEVISQFKNNVSLLGNGINLRKKRMILKKLKEEIDEIIEQIDDENHDIDFDEII